MKQKNNQKRDSVNRKKYILYSLVFIILLVSLVGIKTWKQKNFPKSSNLVTLVFENFKDNTPGSPITTNITDASGNIMKSIYSTQVDSTYDISFSNLSEYISYSKGLLASNEIYPKDGPVLVTKWSVIEHDGSVLPLNSTFDLSTMNKFSYVFVDSGKSILALIRPNTNPATTFRYSQFDLTTGKEKILLSISPANSVYYPHFIPEDINQSTHTVSFLVNDVMVNSQTIQGVATLLYNISSGTLTVHPLPTNLYSILRTKVTDPYASGIPSVGVSLDGNVLVYQSQEIVTHSENNMPQWRIHIYDVQRKKDSIVPTQIIVPGGYNSYFFSPNNTYFVLYFENTMDIVETSDGKIVQSFNLGGDPNNPNPSEYLYSITPVGWMNNETLAYITQRSDTPGSSNFSGNALSHVVDVQNHTVFDFPLSLGKLTAILY